MPVYNYITWLLVAPKAIKLEGKTVQKRLQKYHILSGPPPLLKFLDPPLNCIFLQYRFLI